MTATTFGIIHATTQLNRVSKVKEIRDCHTPFQFVFARFALKFRVSINSLIMAVNTVDRHRINE